MMRETIGKTGISDEALAAYFDGEATDAEASAIRRAIDDDPDLAAELEQLGVMQELTQVSLTQAAEEVPQARFEQLWDQIDRAIEQDERLQESANTPAGLWDRLKAAFAPVKWPMAAAGVAAAVTVVVMNSGLDAPEGAPSPAVAEQGTNKTPEAPSVSPVGATPKAALTPEAKAPSVMPDSKTIAQRMPEDDSVAVGQPLAPVPEDSRADVHEIEGAGSDVRISNAGTVTVLYVEEDVTDQGSERSL